MTEPTSNPAQTPAPAPGSPSPYYPLTPPAGAQPPTPPGTQPPSPPGAQPPAAPAPGPQPGIPPAYPGAAQPYPPQPAYPAAGLPGQPGVYPTSAVPASAMPMSGYPMYVAPAARVSPWIWVLAAVSFVLLLAASGLGLAFLGGQDRISELERTVASLEEEGDELRGDLEDAQACRDAFDDWWVAPVGQDEDEWSAVLDACR